MNKKIVALSVVILLFACCLTTTVFNNHNNIADESYVNMDSFAAKNGESTTSLQSFVSDKVNSATNINGIIGDVSDLGNSLGGLVDVSGLVSGGSGSGSGLGDAISGLGGALGDIINGGSGSGSGSGSGGTGSNTYPVNTETLGYIDIVPAASDFTVSITSPASTQGTTSSVNETVDFAATSNPYVKPSRELKGGDTGEDVKWIQWIFIYTRYGLKDDGITGVFDEDTMAVVKKLQKENGLPVDGVVNDEVLDKIELLYYQTIFTTATPATVTESEEISSTVQNNAIEKEKNLSGVVAMLVIVALVWIAAIACIVIFFIKKKRKKN